MKKNLMIIIIIICFISLIGCTNNNGNDITDSKYLQLKQEEQQKEFLGVELTEEELNKVKIVLDETIYLYIKFLEFNEIMTNDYSYYEIEYHENQTNYICGYMPEQYYGDIMTIVYYYLIISSGVNGIDSMVYLDRELKFSDIRWYKYTDINHINMFVDENYILLPSSIIQIDKYTILKDVINNVEINQSEEYWSECFIDLFEEERKSEKTNHNFTFKSKKYLVPGQINEIQEGIFDVSLCSFYYEQFSMYEVTESFELLENITYYVNNKHEDIDLTFGDALAYKYHNHIEKAKNCIKRKSVDGRKYYVYYDYNDFIKMLKEIRGII